MQNRLQELKKFKMNNNEPIYDKDVDISINSNQSQQLTLDFNDRIKRVQAALDKIKDNDIQLSKLTKDYDYAMTQEEKEITKTGSQLIDKTAKLNNEVKNIFGTLKEDLDSLKEKDEDDMGYQNKEYLYRTLANKFSDQLNESSNIQLEYKQKMRSKIVRQTQQQFKNIGEEEMEEIVNDPDRYQEMIQQKLMGQASVDLKNAFCDIQDRHRELRKLEESIKQICTMLNDIALLVQHQGEMLDNIEMNVKKTVKNTQAANKKLDSAKKHHQAWRKKMCCFGIISLVVLIIILSTAIPK